MARVLIVGGGGREHAIAKQMLASPKVTTVYCAPGNPGMLQDGIQTVAIDELDFAELISFVQNHEVSLTFVGPENPLAAGIVDQFQAAGLRIFGPTKATAQMESSKEFAKEFMQRHQIPTAKSTSFTDFTAAASYVQQHSFPLVIKANGLAGGKGVTIAMDYEQAVTVLMSLFEATDNSQVLIEDYLVGEEYSLMVLVGGDEYVLLPLAQDHKRLLDGDQGPNTGGMGAYSPVPQISNSVLEQTTQTIVEPTLAGLKQEGLAFAGVMYVGLMLTATGPQVIEYNMRLGDPETQILLPQLKSDFFDLITSLIAYQKPVVKWQTTDSYFGVVLAAPGYPQAPVDRVPLPQMIGENIYYAGIQKIDNRFYSHGGRVLMVTAHAASLQKAQQMVYQQLAETPTELVYRKDIGYRGLQYLEK